MIPIVATLMALTPPAPPAAPGEADADRIRATLIAKSIGFEEMKSGDGSILVVPAMGARLLGVFLKGTNALWLHPDFTSPEHWGAGGGRTWIAPEGHDKGLFFDIDGRNWRMPPSLDPGRYRAVPARRAGSRAWTTDVGTTTADGTPLSLDVTREIGPLEDPLGAGRPQGLEYTGALVEHRMRNRGPKTLDREVSLWSLIVGRPDASVVVPVRGREQGAALHDDYYERPAEGRVTERGGALVLRADGPPRTKIGIPPARCRGTLASLRPLGGGVWELVVKRFKVDPDGVYVDRPLAHRDTNGDAVQLYTAPESGPLAFFEMEAHAAAVVLKPGEEQSFPVDLLVYRGPKNTVLEAAGRLLDVRTAELPLPAEP